MRAAHALINCQVNSAQKSLLVRLYPLALLRWKGTDMSLMELCTEVMRRVDFWPTFAVLALWGAGAG